MDLDGVITDFNSALHHRLGIPLSYENWPYTPGLWDYFDEVPGASCSRINGVCDENFWVNMDWMFDGKTILAILEEKYGKKNIYLLTCPMPNDGSWTGKYLWVLHNMPDYTERLIITRASKWEFAGPDTILFDDCNENVSKFAVEGGYCCLIPRPWNSRHKSSDRTSEILKQYLESDWG